MRKISDFIFKGEDRLIKFSVIIFLLNLKYIYVSCEFYYLKSFHKIQDLNSYVSVSVTHKIK